jgi:HSP20 family molecular chaperone IbpA
MQDTKEVAGRQAESVQRERRSEIVLRPPADIFEDADGITVQMDVPGASKQRLNLQASADRLDVEAEVQIEMPDGMEAIYADVRSTRYQRTFALSSELDADNVEATLKDGVLTLRIPKRAELRPRKIEIRAA